MLSASAKEPFRHSTWENYTATTCAARWEKPTTLQSGSTKIQTAVQTNTLGALVMILMPYTSSTTTASWRIGRRSVQSTRSTSLRWKGKSKSKKRNRTMNGCRNKLMKWWPGGLNQCQGISELDRDYGKLSKWLKSVRITKKSES